MFILGMLKWKYLFSEIAQKTVSSDHLPPVPPGKALTQVIHLPHPRQNNFQNSPSSVNTSTEVLVSMFSSIMNCK